MLVRKHLSGSDVGFAEYKREEVKVLLGWMEDFGREDDVFWYDMSVD